MHVILVYYCDCDVSGWVGFGEIIFNLLRHYHPSLARIQWNLFTLFAIVNAFRNHVRYEITQGDDLADKKWNNERRCFDPEIAFTTELSEYLSHASLERVDMLAFRQVQIIEIFENAINITSMWKTLELLTERKNFRFRCLINEGS